MKQSTAEVKIEVGSVIRSHDFWPCGDRPDSYMEGVVLAMDVGSFQNPSGSGMVEFKVTRRVFGGVERPEEIGTVARAPLPFEIGDGLFGDWAGRIEIVWRRARDASEVKVGDMLRRPSDGWLFAVIIINLSGLFLESPYGHQEYVPWSRLSEVGFQVGADGAEGEE